VQDQGVAFSADQAHLPEQFFNPAVITVPAPAWPLHHHQVPELMGGTITLQRPSAAAHYRHGLRCPTKPGLVPLRHAYSSLLIEDHQVIHDNTAQLLSWLATLRTAEKRRAGRAAGSQHAASLTWLFDDALCSTAGVSRFSQPEPAAHTSIPVHLPPHQN
jgi:hypothetical protein